MGRGEEQEKKIGNEENAIIIKHRHKLQYLNSMIFSRLTKTGKKPRKTQLFLFWMIFLDLFQERDMI